VANSEVVNVGNDDYASSGSDLKWE